MCIKRPACRRGHSGQIVIALFGPSHPYPASSSFVYRRSACRTWLRERADKFGSRLPTFCLVAFGCRGDGTLDAVAQLLPLPDGSLFSRNGSWGKSLESWLDVLSEEFVVAVDGGWSCPFMVDHEVRAEPPVRLLFEPFDLRDGATRSR